MSGLHPMQLRGALMAEGERGFLPLQEMSLGLTLETCELRGDRHRSGAVVSSGDVVAMRPVLEDDEPVLHLLGREVCWDDVH
jgi:hypothetical protein